MKIESKYVLIRSYVIIANFDNIKMSSLLTILTLTIFGNVRIVNFDTITMSSLLTILTFESCRTRPLTVEELY